MRFFFIIAVLLMATCYTTAQSNDSIILKNKSIAVLMELPFEWCLVSKPCGGGLTWTTTLKYEILHPKKDTILVQIFCPYILLKTKILKTGKLVRLKLSRLKKEEIQKNLNTYFSQKKYVVYKLLDIKKNVCGLRKKGIKTRAFYQKKYQNKIQDPKGAPCACCPE
ncbi:MAG: hypothetical protein GY810_29365 [Aureispira sp.]|nr:hypothetical protein [Aureispira sp.]